MKSSDTINKLATAFAAAQSELKNAAFDKINPHFKAKYATLAGVRDTVTPVLSKHGLSVVQGSDVHDNTFIVTTRLMHSSGQWIESAYPFAMDKPQQMGSAMTYARRYSLAAICGIASEEDDDANAAQTGEAAMNKPANDAPSPAPKAQSREPFDKISKGIRQIEQTGTMEELRKWRTSHLETIKAFPTDWRDEILKQFTDAKDAFGAKAA